MRAVVKKRQLMAHRKNQTVMDKYSASQQRVESNTKWITHTNTHTDTYFNQNTVAWWTNNSIRKSLRASSFSIDMCLYVTLSVVCAYLFFMFHLPAQNHFSSRRNFHSILCNVILKLRFEALICCCVVALLAPNLI